MQRYVLLIVSCLKASADRGCNSPHASRYGYDPPQSVQCCFSTHWLVDDTADYDMLYTGQTVMGDDYQLYFLEDQQNQPVAVVLRKDATQDLTPALPEVGHPYNLTLHRLWTLPLLLLLHRWLL